MAPARSPAPDEPTPESYAPALQRYFRRHLDLPDADDLVQEVLMGMQARRSAEPIENLNGYIFSVAANVLRQYRRRRAVMWRFNQAIDEAVGHAESDAPSPERTMLGRDGLTRALAIIQSLPPRTRDIFVLHRFEELTYAAIAARMGVSVSAIEKHMMAALRALADLRSDLR